MKKILSLLTVILMVISIVVSIWFIKTDVTLKLGLGVYSYYENVSDATGAESGQAAYVTTAAAVLIDNEGRVIKCDIDSAQVNGGYTSDGKFISKTEYKTKGELGYDYGMKKYGAKKEWFEQVDAFEKQVIGKTSSEIASLMVNGKGNADVIAAGCTISIADFVKAVDMAIKNAKPSTAKNNDSLNLAISSTLSGTNANIEKNENGTLSFETTIAAVALDEDGKITACANDCLAPNVEFDANGKTKGTYKGEIKSKATLKESYGMSAAGKTEWYKQAEAFDNACLGKTADEIAGLMGPDYKGIPSVQNAGCTIYVSGMVKIITKAAK